MNRTIAVSAAFGALLAAFWAIYAAITFPISLAAQPMLWDVVQITCPIASASAHFHFGVKLYWAIVANALTYAFLAMLVGTVRKQVLRRA